MQSNTLSRTTQLGETKGRGKQDGPCLNKALFLHSQSIMAHVKEKEKERQMFNGGVLCARQHVGATREEKKAKKIRETFLTGHLA